MKPEKEEAGGLAPVDLKSTTELAAPPTPTSDSVQAFDWENDPAVILHDQAATAAILSTLGELIIRQRDTLGAEASVYVTEENVAKFLDGLRDRARPTAPTTMLRVVKGGAE
jgi:hypothetical protein